MAGDWIKVEHSTLDKPEVYRIADLLGVTPEHALGLMVRFWVWLDRNSCNGSVTLMYAKSIDAVMRCDGFAACLADVGWAAIDENKGVLTINNFDRHNGKPAKSRALTRDRVNRSRNACVTQTPLPEKRREENKNIPPLAVVSTREPEKRKHTCPKDFGISERVVTWAAKEGHDRLRAHFDHFMSYVKIHNPKYVDWDEAFMRAIRENYAKLPRQSSGVAL